MSRSLNAGRDPSQRDLELDRLALAYSPALATLIPVTSVGQVYQSRPMAFQADVSIFDLGIRKMTANELKQRSLDIYREGAESATKQGIIIADTKFE